MRGIARWCEWVGASDLSGLLRAEEDGALVTTFASFHIKKEVSNRFIVCDACVQAGDEHLGRSFAARACARCHGPIETGLVIQVPRPVKRSKK